MMGFAQLQRMFRGAGAPARGIGDLVIFDATKFKASGSITTDSNSYVVIGSYTVEAGVAYSIGWGAGIQNGQVAYISASVAADPGGTRTVYAGKYRISHLNPRSEFIEYWEKELDSSVIDTNLSTRANDIWDNVYKYPEKRDRKAALIDDVIQLEFKNDTAGVYLDVYNYHIPLTARSTR